MNIGNTTRDIKLRLINYEFDLISNSGHVTAQYYYEVDEGGEVRVINVHTFLYPITNNLIAQTDMDIILNTVKLNVPVP